MRSTFVSLGLILLLLTLGISCGKEKSDDPPEPPYWEEAIVATWEWVYFEELEYNTIEYMDEDELYWVFTEEGEYCDPEFDDSDSCYHMSCQGSYTMTATTMTVECSDGTGFTAAWGFSRYGDTLYCLLDLNWIVMKRDGEPRDFDGE